MGSRGPLKTNSLEGWQTKFERAMLPTAPLNPYSAPAEQTISSAKTPHWLQDPWGQVGCNLVEQLFPPHQGPESLICLENKIQSKSRSCADINETSVLSGKFSTRHFHSNMETVLAPEGRQSLGCSTVKASWLFPQFSSAQDDHLSPDTGNAPSTMSQFVAKYSS